MARNFALIAALGLVAPVLADEANWVDLRVAVETSGNTLGVQSTALFAGGAGESGSAEFLFNGIVYAKETGTRAQRVLFMGVAGDGFPSVTVTLPDISTDFAVGKRIVLRRVDLFPVTYSNNAKKRMPTEYVVTGVDDESSVEEVLAHPKEQEYPNLGENAKSNEFYSVDIEASEVAERGYRQYRIEFLDSPVMGHDTGSIVASLMEIRLWVEILDDDQIRRELYDTRSLSLLLREAGYLIPELIYGQNVYSTAGNLFDGKQFSLTSDAIRWLGYINRANGTYGEIRLPNDFRPDEALYLRSCRLWGLSNSGNEIRRSPTSWKVLGLADATSDSVWKATDDAGWTELVSRAGDDWSNVKYNVQGRNTLGKIVASGASNQDGCRAFRFRPLATKATAEGETGIDVGLNELDLFVIPVNPKGTLRVRTLEPGVGFVDCLNEGALFRAPSTLTAPEYVEAGLRLYRVKGYRLETFDYGTGAWDVGESVSGRSYEYVPDAAKTERFVWELEQVGQVFDIVRDGGNERIVVDPVKDFYQPEDVVTVTATPNSDLLEEAAGATNRYRSAFVRWEGDTNGLADVTSPTIEVTVGEGRRLVPVFRRDWLVYEYDLANEGGTGKEWRMRDGNFEMRISINDLRTGALAYGQGWLVAGHGSFDLDTKIVFSDTGAQATVYNLALQQLGSDAARRADFTRVVLPSTLTKCVCTAFRDQTNLVEAVIDCPELTAMGTTLFTRDTSLRRVVFNAPKLQEISGDYLFFNAPMDETDASDWHLDSLTNFAAGVGQNHFSLGEYNKVASGDYGFYGTLTLPRIMRIGEMDFGYQKHVRSVELGSAKGSLRHIGPRAFYACYALESLTIGCGEDLTVDSAAFYACRQLKDVTFLKSVPSAEAVDAILTNATASARVNLYMTPNRPIRDGFIQTIDTEKDPNPPAGAVGVYETADGNRKAWIFYRESPLDPKGLMLLVR